jgi:hypothetical protein
MVLFCYTALCITARSRDYSVELLTKVFSATPCYAIQCEIQANKFLAHSILHSADSQLCAMHHSTE